MYFVSGFDVFLFYGFYLLGGDIMLYVMFYVFFFFFLDSHMVHLIIDLYL